ncbi:MAG: hypothetical protein HY681_11285 [Chloroflexi bacterium]|nr:hypothetical protein [Chloroflexota bacterium]
MGWIIVGILAAVYLLFRFAQMTRFVFVRFFFNPVIPLPVKVVVLALVMLAVWGVWKWWKWYFKTPETPRQEP